LQRLPTGHKGFHVPANAEPDESNRLKKIVATKSLILFILQSELGDFMRLIFVSGYWNKADTGKLIVTVA